ncbi:MAG TPA: DUF2585 family protein [Pyrinomonadaceae bacterium]|nr:DUF2585 family protein [Pyrinomonadaceae bacterium]
MDQRKLVPAVGATVVFALMALALSAEGRMFFCACGVFKFWVGDTCSSSNSQQLFDPYSFTHILHGFLLFWLLILVSRKLAAGWQFVLALALEAAWEVFENTRFVIDHYRTETAALGYEGDTIVNSFGDLACALVGFLVAKNLGLKRSLVVFLMVEVVLLVWIKDSLLLQLLMLLRPVGSIKLWQMCR